MGMGDLNYCLTTFTKSKLIISMNIHELLRLTDEEILEHMQSISLHSREEQNEQT